MKPTQALGRAHHDVLELASLASPPGAVSRNDKEVKERHPEPGHAEVQRSRELRFGWTDWPGNFLARRQACGELKKTPVVPDILNVIP